ncbi:ParB/RepB/Spo0J family partition protein [Streptacidiphilus sp. N1-12]|uniref:ParB/RepB/Spo0J family partition protein n=1 Tax=Streptacidiphilus alkalitolerans TaxID=3342712 RepID=A0ABV6WR85_9ACTN
MARVRLSSISTVATEDRPGTNATVLVHLRVATVAATPVNSRRNFGTPEELTELGESMRRRQLQPGVAVTRAAYLALWPEHAERIGEAAHVLANGERRLRAARQVGLETFDVIIRDDIATTRATFLDAVFTENIQRRNFDPIEEARAVEALIAEFGTGQAVAAHYEKSGGWVTQRRILLKLTPELQELVSSRKIPLEIAREIGKLPDDQQLDAWLAHSAPKPAANEAREAVDASTPGGTATAGESFTAVKPKPTKAAAAGAALTDEASGRSGSVPDQRDSEQASPPAVIKDWHDIEHVSQVILDAMDPKQVYQLLELIADRLKALR